MRKSYRHRWLLRALGHIGFLMCIADCNNSYSDAVSAGAADRRHSAPPAPTRYARARWRLASPQTLHRVGLWFSHILIRDREHCLPDAPFGPQGWEPLETTCPRTRAEALSLLDALHAELQVHANEFGRLASAYSQDVVSRGYGGAVGGMSAEDLSDWPELLDVLSALKPGAISEVVETRFGFHLIRREPVPSDAALAAERIVVSYTKAPWLTYFRRWDLPDRSRAEALARAQDVALHARMQPADFESLAATFSDHMDGEWQGDIGVWSSREPSPIPLELHVLAGLQQGEVSQPIDTRMGFVLLKRVPAQPRDSLAASIIRLRFDPQQPSDQPDSKAAQRSLAQQIADVLRDKPDAFSDYQKQYCCAEPQRWRDGRGSYAVTQAIKRLPFGVVMTDAVEAEQAFVIARRLDPSTLPAEPAWLFELPNSPQVDLEYLVKHATAPVVTKYTTLICERTSRALSLPPDRLEQFRQLHEELARALAASDQPDDRALAFRTSFAQLESMLGRTLFQRYTEIVNAMVADTMMTTH